MGLSSSSVFKPIQQTPRYHISLAEDECTPFKGPGDCLLISYTGESEVRVDPSSTVETVQSLKKFESRKRGGKKHVGTAASCLPHAHCTLLLRIQGSTSV